jgi:SulP family sulfate permease
LIVILTRTLLKSFGIIVALIVASAIVPLLDWDSVALVRDIADMPDGLPRPVLPELSGILDLIVPAFALAFVGLVQGAGVSQNYINPDGNYPDASGDFRGQGAANIAAGFFQGMPVGGSLSATALVTSSGAKTRSANIIAGLVIAVVVVFFSGAVGLLAMPALAGLLMVIGYQTIKPDEVVQVWKTGAVQKVVLVSTFGATMIMPLQYAVLVGVVLSTLLFVVKQSSKITIKEWVFEEGAVLPVEQEPQKTLPSEKVTVLRPYGSLFYAAASAFEDQLPEITDDLHAAVVILNLRGRTELGSTFLEVIERYTNDLRDHDSRLILAEVKRNLYSQLDKTGYIKFFGIENVFVRKHRVAESVLEANDKAEKWIAQKHKGND